jgi:subtilisin family serine protease
MDEGLTVFWRILLVALALVVAAPATASAASDPLLPDQWALADPSVIGAEEAWTQTDGAGALVAILDTGLQLDHPDLAANVWTNPKEIPGNGIDDDRSGVVDDVHGANMFDLTNNVRDDNGHGTHVAGIVAARQNNGIGGSGLAPAAKILPVKVLDAGMSGTTDTLALGIRYAVDRGARILNVSVNTDVPTEAVTSAVRYAGERGAIIVASAGNNGRNIDLDPSYPASLPDPAVFSVAAQSDGQGLLWNLSNTGLKSVDLAAPGARIIATAANSGYQSRTGTSAAAPFVAASLALLSSAAPDLPMSTLRAAIADTTRRSDLLSRLLGGGRLDVGAAMHRALQGRPWKTAAVAHSTPALKLSTRSRVRSGSRVALRWTATAAAAVTTWRVSLDGRVVARVAADKGGVSRRISKTGRHTWRVVGMNAAGEKVVSARRSFTIVRKR